MTNKTTHFGFQIVEKNSKPMMVNNVFNSVAKKYDLMNDLMSLGIHRIWKYVAIKYSNIRHGQCVLDLASGTGDLAVGLSNLIGDKGKLIVADINYSMLNLGRKKLRNKGIINNTSYIQANAESLPFLSKTFDCVTISFGIRNFNEQEKSLKDIYRVIKPGGKLIVLEFSKPLCKLFSKFYNFYSLNILPKIGKIVTNDVDSYRYLAESIQIHPDQESFKVMMLNAGFCNVNYFNMTGGIVALHYGYKF